MKNLLLNELKKLRLKNFIGLFIAGIINAIGVTLFIAPAKLYDSGISGTSIFLDQITPEHLTLSIFLVVLNVPLFLFGLKKQGISFTIYAIFTVVIYSLASFVITNVLPIKFVEGVSPVSGNDLLLCALFGGIVSGMGSGLAIRFGGAMDGVEVLAVIFSKKIGITVGTFVMIFNVILYVVAGIWFGSWTLPLYSIVTYMAGLKTVDFIVEGIDRSKAATIITSMPEEICKQLSQEFECGITTYKGQGFYSKEEKTIVYIILNRFQIGKMKRIVSEIDRTAYVSICEVADVFSVKNLNKK